MDIRTCSLPLHYRFFVYLSKEGDRTKFDLNFATQEARKCADFLSQAQHHLARARRVDDEERALKEKQEMEREELNRKQQEEVVRREGGREERKEGGEERRSLKDVTVG